MSAVLIALPVSRIVGLALGALVIAAAVLTVLRHRNFSHLVPLSVFVALIALQRPRLEGADIANQALFPLFCRVVRKPDILLSTQLGHSRFMGHALDLLTASFSLFDPKRSLAI